MCFGRKFWGSFLFWELVRRNGLFGFGFIRRSGSCRFGSVLFVGRGSVWSW